MSILSELSEVSQAKKIFDYIQIGVTSRCYLNCIMCPRSTSKRDWKSIDMTTETYLRISEFFPYANNVYLSGWGEPLLNPSFFDMLRIAKEKRCSVGFTTNGSLLTEAANKKILQLETDLVCISIAGTRSITHESIRRDSSFINLKQNIQDLAKCKTKGSHEYPKIMLLFMMTKMNMHELPLSIEMAGKIGADGIIATNLDYVSTTVQDNLKAFSSISFNSKIITQYEKKVDETQRLADKHNIFFHAFPLRRSHASTCSENPLNNLYVSESGLVSPCVYLNPPLKRIPRIFCGRSVPVPRFYFGDLTKENLIQIWNKREYIEFRNKHKQASTKEGHKNSILPDICRNCYKAYGI